jgi:hypothetical protein
LFGLRFLVRARRRQPPSPLRDPGKLRRRLPIERGVWTHRVVVDPPGFDHRVGFGDAEKPVLIQTFIAKLSVETFDVGVLDRLWVGRFRAARVE